MLRKLFIGLASLAALSGSVQAAGTVPGFSLTPQFDLLGKVAPGCKLYVYQAGTTSTPQNSYYDTALTILQPNPITCDSTGRLPQWFVADGQIKLRLTDKNGGPIFVGDNLLVLGPSSGGGGGGGSVDPTTILATGDMKLVYNTGLLTGFVRANGRTIGSVSSGATERANADTSALFVFLWTADPNLVVSGGRGASGAADFAANKTIVLPDWRGRNLAGLDDMGNSPAGVLTTATTGFGPAVPTTLGQGSGQESKTLLTTNLPPYTPAGSVGSSSFTLYWRTGLGGGAGQVVDDIENASVGGVNRTTIFTVPGGTFTGTPAPGQNSTPFATIAPTRLLTIYLKL